MTKQYIVTGIKARFGPGFVLELSEKQATSRLHCLKKRKGKHYEVISSVEFKQEEVIGVVKGTVPKALEGTLEERTSQKEEKLPPPDSFKMEHKGFGKWDVLDSKGKALNDKPLTKQEAQALIDRMQEESGI
jgi:hypothetical protein